MQLNIETDYTVRCILYLAQEESFRTAADVGKKMYLEHSEAKKLLDRLHDAGIVKTQRGREGGYMLAMKPERIMVRDVLCVSEDTIKINRCLEQDGFCNRNATCDCPMHQFYQSVQDMLEQVFDNTSIQDILDGKAAAYSRLS